MADIGATIIPKSDQLNADNFAATGPITIKITSVDVNKGSEQPVTLHYEGENGRPYKPGKSMRRVISRIWGNESGAYPGQSMTLYCDPEVVFGGLKVGGIRISHMSGIKEKVVMALTATKGKKKPFEVLPLSQKAPPAANAGAGQASDDLPDLDSIEAETASGAPPGDKWLEWADSLDAEHADISDAAKLHGAISAAMKTEEWAELKERHPKRALGIRDERTGRIAKLKGG